MSFFKKLFGGGGSASDAVAAEPIEYNGFTIRPAPYAEGGQFQMCGVIEKEINGALKSHRFIRAEKFPGKPEADEFTIQKAKQIIDQMGDRIFQ